MKFLLSSLLLASHCALSSWSASSDRLVVSQPLNISAIEGETVNISCCWTGERGNFFITWLKNQTGNIVQQERYSNTLSSCLALTISNISTEDSGRYICRVTVEIPYLRDFYGNGTDITVTPREDNNDNRTKGHQEPEGNQVLIISLAVVAPLLLVALVCFCTLQRRQAQAARVIYEVPHIDSEVADADKHSTSSSNGSTQWCQVPVYESFDYFESARTKETE